MEFVCYIVLFILTLLPEPRSTRETYTLLDDDINEVCSDVLAGTCVCIHEYSMVNS